MGKLCVKFTIYSAPRTKKNHGWRTKQGHHMPSKAWLKWRDSCRFSRPLPSPPLAVHMNCKATFYLDARRGDAVGYYQGLGDLLESWMVVLNDKYIVSWDGSSVGRSVGGVWDYRTDKENPRVEVELTEI